MDLTGTWRIEMEVRSTADVAMVRGLASTTVTVGVVGLREDGDRWLHQQRTCAVEIRDDNPLAKTGLPEALVSSLPPSSGEVEVGAGRYRVDLGTSFLGYAPTDPADSLPLLPTDPSVVDAEGDGRPGATIRVRIAGVGDFGVDVVQRSRAVLEGRVVDDGEIRGRVQTVDFAQSVLAADLALLRRGPVIRYDDERSTFVMTRLPDGAGCAEALGAADRE